MKLYKAGTFEVNYNNAHSILTLKCNTDLNVVEFREGVLAALRYAEAFVVKQWVFDFSQIGKLNEKEQVWLGNYLFPRLMMSLGSENYVAMVLSEECYRELLNDSGKDGLHSYNSFILLNTFCVATDAENWLVTQAIHKAS
ncbi:hypothetical protein [Pontibacter oryzae]|uniref:STAS/SEC14 domain-containing protein n=1 Tax=Pontibacter oryzae TaxID=2304593 RepID=A0A399SDV1_9BACT|nr:hypothetical protein [Pontibacter oryzae]RIJ41860.1 hypothetical protein D1627_07565 [Pontibacter oryzae]